MQKTSERHPLVSVVFPTRNSQATIGTCLRSIREQSYSNIEIIVVDNYSKDKTRRIARKYGARVYLKGPERSTQVNFGVEKALGKYVYRVDSDSLLHPNIIKEAVEICENEGYDAIAVHNTSDPTISFWSRVRKVERDCYRNDDLNVAARFWKKEVFEAVGGFDENLVAGDDYDLHNRLLNKGFKIGRIASQEIHIGEPKTLTEIFLKHFYYGKSIELFIEKNSMRALRQLTPLRASYVKAFPRFVADPMLMGGFVIYQFVRYAAAMIGVLSTRINRK